MEIAIYVINYSNANIIKKRGIVFNVILKKYVNILNINFDVMIVVMAKNVFTINIKYFAKIAGEKVFVNIK